MSEQALQKKIIKYLEARGYYVLKIIISSKKGKPDIIGCTTEGLFFGIEVKLKGNNPTRLQQYNIDEINRTGGFAMVAYSVEDVATHL